MNNFFKEFFKNELKIINEKEKFNKKLEELKKSIEEYNNTIKYALKINQSLNNVLHKINYPDESL